MADFVTNGVRENNSQGDKDRDPQSVAWTDENEYDTTHERRGIAVIIVNENFDDNKRKGSEHDATSLCRAFSCLGFDVRLAKDCRVQALTQILKSVALEDHSGFDCFVLVISSHGDQRLDYTEHYDKLVRQDVIRCVDGDVTTREIVLFFSDNNSPSLKGKPRLFFLQACRGQQLDAGQDVIVSHRPDVGSDEVDASFEPEIIVSPAPCFMDCLIMYATPPGYYAFRRDSEGSWFIQALCSVLETCDESQTLLQLLTRVVRKVALEYQSCVTGNPEYDGKKQSPCIYSMLTKELVLTRKKLTGKIATLNT